MWVSETHDVRRRKTVIRTPKKVLFGSDDITGVIKMSSLGFVCVGVMLGGCIKTASVGWKFS